MRPSTAYKGSLDSATKFIPTWVKIAVAIALGLGTMIGWKRIVVTVGEKIGKTHLTYAQGACAEITAAATIAAADVYGLPVSTTHVLSSGIAGTMAANGSGLQWSTIRNIALAWVLTLPAAMILSGCLYLILSRSSEQAIRFSEKGPRSTRACLFAGSLTVDGSDLGEKRSDAIRRVGLGSYMRNVTLPRRDASAVTPPACSRPA